MKILQKSFFMIAGLAFMSIGIACMWVSYVMITEPVQVTDLAKAREVTFQECVNYAGENQYNLRVKSEAGKEITLTSRTLNDWEQQILSASNILSHCDGVELKEFCIGSECSIDGKAHRGLYMKLEYDKSKEVIVFQ